MRGTKATKAKKDSVTFRSEKKRVRSETSKHFLHFHTEFCNQYACKQVSNAKQKEIGNITPHQGDLVIEF